MNVTPDFHQPLSTRTLREPRTRPLRSPERRAAVAADYDCGVRDQSRFAMRGCTVSRFSFWLALFHSAFPSCFAVLRIRYANCDVKQGKFFSRRKHKVTASFVTRVYMHIFDSSRIEPDFLHFSAADVVYLFLRASPLVVSTFMNILCLALSFHCDTHTRTHARTHTPTHIHTVLAETHTQNTQCVHKHTHTHAQAAEKSFSG